MQKSTNDQNIECVKNIHIFAKNYFWMKKIALLSLLIITMSAIFALDIDADILRKVNTERIKSLDVFFIALSFTAEYLYLFIPLGIILWGVVKKNNIIRNKGYFVFIILIINSLISFALKNSFDRVRPFAAYDFVEKISVGGSSSFPSGHTMSAITLAFAVSLMFKNRYLQIFLFAWAILVGYSRMHCGVHYFTDVLAGAFVGLIATYGFYLLFKKNKWLI